MKLFMIFFFLTFASELTYQDSFGNDFVLENAEKIPTEIGFDFLKSNLNTKHLIKDFVAKTYNYKFVIVEAQKKEKWIYELKVRIIPQTEDKKNIEEITKYLYPKYFLLKTKKVDNKLELESVKFYKQEI